MRTRLLSVIASSKCLEEWRGKKGWAPVWEAREPGRFRRVGERDSADRTIQRSPTRRVLVHKRDDLRRRDGSTVGEDAVGFHDPPPLVVAAPKSLDVPPFRIKDPRLELVCQRIPTDALRAVQERPAGDPHRELADQKVLVGAPAAGGMHHRVIAFVNPIPQHPLQFLEPFVRGRGLVGLFGNVGVQPAAVAANVQDDVPRDLAAAVARKRQGAAGFLGDFGAEKAKRLDGHLDRRTRIGFERLGESRGDRLAAANRLARLIGDLRVIREQVGNRAGVSFVERPLERRAEPRIAASSLGRSEVFSVRAFATSPRGVGDVPGGSSGGPIPKQTPDKSVATIADDSFTLMTLSPIRTRSLATDLVDKSSLVDLYIDKRTSPVSSRFVEAEPTRGPPRETSCAALGINRRLKTSSGDFNRESKAVKRKNSIAREYGT